MLFSKKQPYGVFCRVSDEKGVSSLSQRTAVASSLKWDTREAETHILNIGEESVQSTQSEAELECVSRDEIDCGVSEIEVTSAHIVERRKSLPQTTGRYGSHHVLVNSERLKRNLMPLMRDGLLDDIALTHAKEMAAKGKLKHSHIASTAGKAATEKGTTINLLGENIMKQLTSKNPTRQAHRKLLMKSSALANILDSRFSSFGVGSEVNQKTGTVYICQLYAGEAEE
jgi:hypothetical protein